MPVPSLVDSPLKYFGSNLKAFDVDYSKAREDSGNVVKRFDFRWITGQDNVISYEIEFEVERLEQRTQIFSITLEPLLVERVILWGKTEKTKATFIQTEIDGGVRNQTFRYDEQYPDKCKVTASKMLLHFAMIHSCIINEVDIVLPPNIAKFPRYYSWNPSNLTVTVDTSIKDKHFVGKWLDRILFNGADHLTINSTHHDVDIFSNRVVSVYLLNVNNLTINAKTRVDKKLLSDYKKMNIIYNDPNGDSPITLEEFLNYWNENKETNKKQKRRIEFNCKHPLHDVKGENERKKLFYAGGLYRDNGIVHRPDHQHKRTFEIDENRLVIDIDITEENNENNENELIGL